MKKNWGYHLTRGRVSRQSLRVVATFFTFLKCYVAILKNICILCSWNLQNMFKLSFSFCINKNIGDIPIFRTFLAKFLIFAYFSRKITIFRTCWRDRNGKNVVNMRGLNFEICINPTTCIMVYFKELLHLLPLISMFYAFFVGRQLRWKDHLDFHNTWYMYIVVGMIRFICFILYDIFTLEVCLIHV